MREGDSSALLLKLPGPEGALLLSQKAFTCFPMVLKLNEYFISCVFNAKFRNSQVTESLCLVFLDPDICNTSSLNYR